MREAIFDVLKYLMIEKHTATYCPNFKEVVVDPNSMWENRESVKST